MLNRTSGSRDLFIALVGALAVATACRESQPVGLRTSPDPAIQAIIDAGFRGDMIVDMGSYYLVEGDLSFPKNPFSDIAPGNGPSFQWRTFFTVGQSAVEHIVVNLTGLETSWRTAAQAAMAEWNNPSIMSKLRYIEGSPADITMSMSLLGGNCTTGTVAVADFPTQSGAPGPHIYVSPVFTSCYTASQKKFVMAHELGHAIAFRHTDWQARHEMEVPYGAVQIAGTPPTDANSIMNGNNALYRSWGGFSTYDRVAVRQLYPYPLPAYWTATTTYPSQAVVSFSPIPNGPTAYSVRLTVYGWQVYEGQQYGSSYEAFASPWSSSTTVTLTGFYYTGTSTCSEGDPWVDGSWYREYSMWLDFRYADGVTYELPLIDAPLVMVC